MADRFGNEPVARSPGRRVDNSVPRTDAQTYDPARTANLNNNMFGLYPLQEEGARGVRDVIARDPTPGIDDPVDFTGAINRGVDAQGVGGQYLDDLNRNYYNEYADRGSYTMGSLEQNYPELYEREQAINARNIDPYTQQIGGQSIDPYLERVSTGQIDTRGIDTDDISRFQNPYMDSVVDASLADFDTGADRASNIRRARQAGAGAFGGRQGLYDATLDAETNRQRAGLGAGLRAQGYNQALGAAVQQAGLGQRADISDLDRSLAAQRSNQATMLAGGQTQLQRDLEAQRLNQATALNAGRDQLGRELTAQQATAQNIMNRKLQDAGLAYQGDQQRMNALNQMRQSALQQAGLAQTGSNLALAGNQQQMANNQQQFQQGLLNNQFNLDANRTLYDMGTSQFTQPYQLLNIGTNLFGDRGFTNEDETGQSTSTGTKGSVGFKFG